MLRRCLLRCGRPEISGDGGTPLAFSSRRELVKVFVGAFALGYAVQVFAIRTNLYDTVAENKLRRRLELDEEVLDLQGSIAKWQLEDQRIAERTRGEHDAYGAAGSSGGATAA